MRFASGAFFALDVLNLHASIVVKQLIDTEILCCVVPILEAEWMTAMLVPMPSRIFRVKEGAASLAASRSS